MFKVIDGEFDKNARIYKKIGTEKYFFSTVENCLIKDIPINRNIETLHVLSRSEVEDMLINFKYKDSHKNLRKILKDWKEVCIKCVLKDNQEFIAIVDFGKFLSEKHILESAYSEILMN